MYLTNSITCLITQLLTCCNFIHGCKQTAFGHEPQCFHYTAYKKGKRGAFWVWQNLKVLSWHHLYWYLVFCLFGIAETEWVNSEYAQGAWIPSSIRECHGCLKGDSYPFIISSLNVVSISHYNSRHFSYSFVRNFSSKKRELQNHYEILGIKQSATAKEIKAAFLDQSKKVTSYSEGIMKHNEMKHNYFLQEKQILFHRILLLRIFIVSVKSNMSISIDH